VLKKTKTYSSPREFEAHHAAVAEDLVSVDTILVPQDVRNQTITPFNRQNIEFTTCNGSFFHCHDHAMDFLNVTYNYLRVSNATIQGQFANNPSGDGIPRLQMHRYDILTFGNLWQALCMEDVLDG
jgi:hypothetical protein